MSTLRPGLAIIALWIGFWLSWLAAAGWSAPTDKSVGVKGEIAYRIVLIVGGLVLLVPAHGYRGPLRLWHVTLDQAWACAGAMVLGFAFCWWARIHLGKLWSGHITKKADHRVIDTGPYRIVRHPIYTGILVAVYATAIAKGTIPGVVGALIITVGIWMKARLEEGWLGQELDAQAYATYRRRVPMLIPFGPR
jgi:protein-S-isoprenylcysteine O-methyltransferase Ste14